MLIGLLAYLSLVISWFIADRHFAARSDALRTFERLPARFARLTWVPTVVVSPTAASTAKTMAPAPGAFRLRPGLVDGQGSSAQIGSVKCHGRLISFTGIGHFHERETTGASRIPVGHESYLFHCTVCLEEVSQLGFGCAVGQIPNVKVLHGNSSLSKSSRLVGVAVRFGGRPSESLGGAGRVRIARV